MTNKINGGELYFQTIHEISPMVNEYIRKQITELGLPSDLEGILMELPTKRQGNPIMRSNLTYLIYKNLGGDATAEDIVPALAVSELSNYFAYLDNWVFDNKNNCNQDIEKTKKIVIASEIFRELSQKCIEKINCDDRKKRNLSSKLADSSIKCYDGQFQDLQLSVNRINEFQSDEDYLDVYERKSKMQSGSLYGLSAETGALLAGVKDERTSPAREFGEVLGTGIHISNDLGDFALFLGQGGSFKSYQDQLADIVNGRLSLPIYHVLRHGSENEKEALMNLVGNKNATFEEKQNASLAVLSSGAYEKVKSLLNKYRNSMRKITKQFPQNEYRDALSSINQTLCYNKYLKDLKNMGKIK